MEIKEFIHETISQILDSVSYLNEEYKDKGARIATVDNTHKHDGAWTNKCITDVVFDISLEVITDNESGAGGKLGIAHVFSAGAQTSNKEQNQSVSKVHFSIPIVFPPQQ